MKARNFSTSKINKRIIKNIQNNLRHLYLNKKTPRQLDKNCLMTEINILKSSGDWKMLILLNYLFHLPVAQAQSGGTIIKQKGGLTLGATMGILGAVFGATILGGITLAFMGPGKTSHVAETEAEAETQTHAEVSNIPAPPPPPKISRPKPKEEPYHREPSVVSSHVTQQKVQPKLPPPVPSRKESLITTQKKVAPAVPPRPVLKLPPPIPVRKESLITTQKKIPPPVPIRTVSLKVPSAPPAPPPPPPIRKQSIVHIAPPEKPIIPGIIPKPPPPPPLIKPKPALPIVPKKITPIPKQETTDIRKSLQEQVLKRRQAISPKE